MKKITLLILILNLPLVFAETPDFDTQTRILYLPVVTLNKHTPFERISIRLNTNGTWQILETPQDIALSGDWSARSSDFSNSFPPLFCEARTNLHLIQNGNQITGTGQFQKISPVSDKENGTVTGIINGDEISLSLFIDDHGDTEELRYRGKIRKNKTELEMDKGTHACGWNYKGSSEWTFEKK